LRFPFSGYIVYGGWHLHGINWRASWLFDKRVEELYLPETTELPMPFAKTSPPTTRLALTAKLDRSGWLCKSMDKSIFEGSGLSVGGFGYCNADGSPTRHIAQGTPMVNLGIFGGYDKDITAKGYVSQHMGLKWWYIADDGLTHQTAQYASMELDDYQMLTSLEDFMRCNSYKWRSRNYFRFQFASVLWIFMAGLIGVPALIFAYFMPSARRNVLKISVGVAALIALLAYGYYHIIFTHFTGNSRDGSLLPGRHDMILLALFLLPAFVLIIADNAPTAVAAVRRWRTRMAAKSIAELKVRRENAEDKAPMLSAA